MWEDPANAHGGKWVLTMKNTPALLDRCWAWTAMALVGEELEDGDEICGVVVSLRAKVDRIQIWTRSKEDVEKLNGIAKRLVKVLDISEADSIGLEFQVRVRYPALPARSAKRARSTTRRTALPQTSSSRSSPCRRLASGARSATRPRLARARAPALWAGPKAVRRLPPVAALGREAAERSAAEAPAGARAPSGEREKERRRACAPGALF
jgi:hypothetical protein